MRTSPGMVDIKYLYIYIYLRGAYARSVSLVYQDGLRCALLVQIQVATFHMHPFMNNPAI